MLTHTDSRLLPLLYFFDFQTPKIPRGKIQKTFLAGDSAPIVNPYRKESPMSIGKAIGNAISIISLLIFIVCTVAVVGIFQLVVFILSLFG